MLRNAVKGNFSIIMLTTEQRKNEALEVQRLIGDERNVSWKRDRPGAGTQAATFLTVMIVQPSNRIAQRMRDENEVSNCP